MDIDRQWFKSKVGLAAPETHRDLSFCTYTVLPESPDVVVVLDANKDPRFAGGELVVGYPHVIFYAGAALWVDGEKLGSLCIIDNVPHDTFSLEDQQSLLGIAAIVSQIISSRRSKFLRACKRQSQQLLSLTHNLRTPCMSLELSVKCLAAFLPAQQQELSLMEGGGQTQAQAQAQEDLQLHTEHLARLVRHLTDLCSLMPSLSPTLDSCTQLKVDGPKKALMLHRNGYECDMSSIIGKIQAIIGCMCEKTEVTVAVSPRLQPNKDYVYISFPEIFSTVSLDLIGYYAKLSLNLDVNIIFQKNVSDCDPLENALPTSSDPTGSHDGIVVFDLKAIECVDDSSVLALSSFRRIEDLVRVVGGGCKVERFHDKNTVRYRYWLPMSITPHASLRREKSLTLPLVEKRRLNVLVMESDPATQLSMAIMLSEKKCNVCVKSNGMHGVKEYIQSVENMRASTVKYDLVFVDFLMPVMHGGAVMQQISAWLEQRAAEQTGEQSIDATFVGMLGSGDDCANYLSPIPSTSTDSSDTDSSDLASAYGISHILEKPLDHWKVHSIVDEKLDIVSKRVGLSDVTQQQGDIPKTKRVKSRGYNWLGLRMKENAKVYPT